MKRCKYGKAKLIEAVEAVRKGKFSMYKASKTYQIPKETIRRHVRGEVLDFNNPGRVNLLSVEEERALVDYIQYSAQHNFPLKRQDLRSVVLVSRYTVTYLVLTVINNSEYLQFTVTHIS